MQLGYCGNVHPGRNLQTLQENMSLHTAAVKQAVSPDQAMGIGLWLSATSASELSEPETLLRFRQTLDQQGLVPFTLNGFPFGDFHQPVVKHAVYRPTWEQPSRLEFTIRLANLQNQLLPTEIAASISTLPLGWPVSDDPHWKSQFFQSSASHLRHCAEQLHQLADATGRQTIVCLEPEPGCVLDTATDLVDFFQNHLFTGNHSQDEMIRRHIGVCHDICHSAVMFEDQRQAIELYSQAGIQIGKTQVSSAIDVDFDALTQSEKLRAANQLACFAEPRYLHQTTIKRNGRIQFHEDLTLALQSFNSNDELRGHWRVHFHVPIFADRLGMIGTTQSEIVGCLNALREFQCDTEHFEIETYAWNVLPDEWQASNLAAGIAREWKWFEHLLAGQAPKKFGQS